MGNKGTGEHRDRRTWTCFPLGVVFCSLRFCITPVNQFINIWMISITSLNFVAPHIYLIESPCLSMSKGKCSKTTGVAELQLISPERAHGTKCCFSWSVHFFQTLDHFTKISR